MSTVQLRHGAATDTGRVREVNEDAYLAEPPVFVVADGMGGHEGGDIASAIVVEEFARLAEAGYDPRRGSDAVDATLESAQVRITAYAAEQQERTGREFRAGTTAVAALLVEHDGGPQWLLANLGDSRIYRLAAGRLEQVSVDHSVVQELVASGAITEDAAETHPERHVVTRALGGPGRVTPDYFLVPLEDAARLLLCSDGVTEMLEDERIAEILRSSSDPGEAADALVAAAVEAGGRDNATAVVVDVVGSEAEDRAADADPERRR